MKSAQNLVSGDGIDPDLVRLHQAQELRRGTRFHRVTRLQPFSLGHVANVVDPLANCGAIVKPERCANLVCDCSKERWIESHRERRMMRSKASRIKCAPERPMVGGTEQRKKPRMNANGRNLKGSSSFAKSS